MIINDNVISKNERLIFSLRELYFSNDCKPYRMSKFEEYDLYARNKDFLVSDNVITFNNPNGRLMALKPDVTLSIIKNIKDTPDTVNKLYYNENVYRISKSTDSFKEIMQVGVEYIGQLDNKAVSEVISLSAQSLAILSDSFVLDISDLDLLSKIIDEATDEKSVKTQLIALVGEKNCHGIEEVCKENDISEKCVSALKKLVNLYGRPQAVLPELKEIASDFDALNIVEKIKDVLLPLENETYFSNINLDFSVVSDMNYYNGLVFKGFVSGVPDSVLSGGQYDRLMKKMKKKSKAAGFAVYIDKLLG